MTVFKFGETVDLGARYGCPNEEFGVVLQMTELGLVKVIEPNSDYPIQVDAEKIVPVRKVVQIVGDSGTLYALRSDGAMFSLTEDSSNWFRLPPLPID